MPKEKFIQDLERQFITVAAASVQRAAADALANPQAFVFDAKTDVLRLAQEISFEILNLRNTDNDSAQEAKEEFLRLSS